MTYLSPYGCPLADTYDFQIQWRFNFSTTHGESTVILQSQLSRHELVPRDIFPGCCQKWLGTVWMTPSLWGHCQVRKVSHVWNMSRQVSLQIVIRSSVHLDNAVTDSTYSLRLTVSHLNHLFCCLLPEDGTCLVLRTAGDWLLPEEGLLWDQLSKTCKLTSSLGSRWRGLVLHSCCRDISYVCSPFHEVFKTGYYLHRYLCLLLILILTLVERAIQTWPPVSEEH